MQLTPERRKELLGRLEALSNMTTENGCSEHEAEVAAKMAGRLMEEYGLTLEELEAKPDESIIVESIWTNSTSHHPVARTLNAIAEFTHTTIYRNSRTKRREDGQRLRNQEQGYGFAGTPSDVEVAKFLVQLFKTSMEVSWARHWKEARAGYYTARQAQRFQKSSRSSFMRGMGHRLRTRLYELCEARKAAATSSSRAIIRLTGQLIETKLEAAGILLQSRKSRERYYPDGNYDAGYEAAEGVSISAGFIHEKPQPNQLE